MSTPKRRLFFLHILFHLIKILLQRPSRFTHRAASDVDVLSDVRKKHLQVFIYASDMGDIHDEALMELMELLPVLEVFQQYRYLLSYLAAAAV